MKHDIYSLGVCLLEIGLWEPFIVQKDGDPFMCDEYCRMAVASNIVEQEHSDQIAKLTLPKALQEVMITLAKDALPQRMGLAFTDLVPPHVLHVWKVYLGIQMMKRMSV